MEYSGDLFVTGASEELLDKKVLPPIAELLKERSLELSEKKPRNFPITEGFGFLEQDVRKYKNGKPLITPSKKNVLSKAQDIFGKSKAIRWDELIEKLNPLIPGWDNFHKHFMAKKIFTWINNNIWKI